MPTITINGRTCAFTSGQMILQVALEQGIEIPHYCYHPGLSIVANCRICLAEVWAPNPRNEGRLEAIPKLLPACQTPAGDGQVVYTSSPKAIANQKAVMEYLLINHPVDCAVCDQAGECYLQDYSYQYGRSQSRFQEQKIKQPKKDVGPHVLLYADRCIMCTRCVRFTREVTGTNELIVARRGARSEIDVFPGLALDNELSGNVVDVCPVGALLDKEFLFQQRVWFLHKTPSIDGLTASGDNISIEHNDGRVYRIKPRTNLEVNRWWITDEVRYGWSFIHDESRLTLPRLHGRKPYEAAAAPQAYRDAYALAVERLGAAGNGSGTGTLGVLVSPMLSCEDAYELAALALHFDGQATFAVGPVPTRGEDKVFADGFTMFAEKAPNARGVRRVLEAVAPGQVLDHEEFVKALSPKRKSGRLAALIITGNYPSEWVTEELARAAGEGDRFILLMDTLPGRLLERADVVLPAATWAEKAGTFESARNRLQAFERAIAPIDFCKCDAQLAIDLLAAARGESPRRFDAAATRRAMAARPGLSEFQSAVHLPPAAGRVEPDMVVVDL